MVTTCISSIQCSNIRFLLIFVDFDYENKYDREKGAFIRAFWHLLVPERASERDFFTIICVFIFQTAILAPKRARLYPGSTPALPRLCLGCEYLFFMDFRRF